MQILIQFQLFYGRKKSRKKRRRNGVKTDKIQLKFMVISSAINNIR